jgi:galactokinase
VRTYPSIGQSATRVEARGPGRVNLIGEHTDYNDGLALPFAIARGVTVTAEAMDGESMAVDARDLGESDEFSYTNPERASGWKAFARGIVAELRPGSAARLTIEGDLPRGAGLSSSAALSAALALALLGLDGREMGALDLARLCSRVENEWVGSPTGLLDQLAVLFAREGEALRIDFQSLELSHVPLDLGGWTLATLDSGVTHDNATSGYNERREECERAGELLGIESLRAALESDVARLPEPLDRRVRYVLEENARVNAAVAALTRGDLAELGRLLDASHAGLRDLYEVSTPEVERTVAAMKEAGAVGARIVGGGFGGAVLGLFPPGSRLPGDAFVVEPGPPARLV